MCFASQYTHTFCHSSSVLWINSKFPSQHLPPPQGPGCCSAFAYMNSAHNSQSIRDVAIGCLHCSFCWFFLLTVSMQSSGPVIKWVILWFKKQLLRCSYPCALRCDLSPEYPNVTLGVSSSVLCIVSNHKLQEQAGLSRWHNSEGTILVSVILSLSSQALPRITCIVWNKISLIFHTEED